MNKQIRHENKPTVYIISGPTCIGKSKIAYHLAKRIDGEIVNCDSIQLYKYMDIGSAKPTPAEMSIVKHHLYSIVNPDYEMSVATYQQLAKTVIDDIIRRGKTPIVCGGTGLYIHSILYNMDFGGICGNPKRREELEKMAEENGNEYMHQYLDALDHESAQRIHPNNLRKIIRAIESFEYGKGIKNLDECSLNENYNFKFYALNMDRDWLYSRINQRVVNLFQQGLIAEVENLIELGYGHDTPALKGIGYKEILDAYDGKYDFEEAARLIMRDTRHYAKRQINWLKRYDNVEWIEIEEGESVKDIIDKII